MLTRAMATQRRPPLVKPAKGEEGEKVEDPQGVPRGFAILALKWWELNPQKGAS